jgi:high-affinity iron transporter
VLDLGAALSGLVTGLREGVEAALIVSIVLAYLARTGNRRYFDRIAIGTGGAVLVSLIVGIAIFITVQELREPYEQILEGSTMLVAAAVVTWMLFWMRRQAAGVKGELQHAVDRALAVEGAWALAILAFSSVLREGIETSLFLVGQATAALATGSASSVLLGALVGLLIAGALGVGFYHGSRRLNLGTFFRWTGIFLVFIAAGLLSRAVHEFIEIGVINIGTASAFDLGGILPADASSPIGFVGSFLRALVGYSATPEWSTLIVWIAYVVVVLALYLRPMAPRPVPAATAAAERSEPAVPR